MGHLSGFSGFSVCSAYMSSVTIKHTPPQTWRQTALAQTHIRTLRLPAIPIRKYWKGKGSEAWEVTMKGKGKLFSGASLLLEEFEVSG